ncbi:hypothetical protein [Thalassotalea atypica]|uniref:hypothetical protein n=1 Tax=Thalassotalea atypica TaxID=2054316 RepID=UPI002572F2DE|nr:hypothetical protein [Thalassotalea atypica]
MSCISTLTIANDVKSSSAELSCEQALDENHQLTKLQNMLIQVGLYHVNMEFKDDVQQYKQDAKLLSDSVVGKVTRQWLSSFCSSLIEYQKANVIATLFIYSAIKKVEPDCKAVSNISMLNQWFNKQTQGIEKEWVQGLLRQCSLDSAETLIGQKSYKPNYYMLTAEDMKTISKKDESNKAPNNLTMEVEFPQKILDTLKLVQDKPFPTYRLFAKTLHSILKEDLTSPQFAGVESLANKGIEINNTVLGSADCGCVKNIEDNKVTYNIYPGWLYSAADKEHVAPMSKDKEKAKTDKLKKIDYSTISRIGYQGLSLSENGKFNHETALKYWYKASEKFIKQANQHYSKKDIIVELENWKSWDKLTIKEALTSFKYNILNPEHYAASSKSMPIDGVTLYFPDYSSEFNLQLSEIADEFISLKKDHAEFHVNVLLDIAICGANIDCSTAKLNTPLVDLKTCEIAIGGKIKKQEESSRCAVVKSEGATIEEQEAAKHKVDMETLNYVLIYLPEKTTETKKHLRRVIENTFKGEGRSKMLNKIIPIIVPYDLSQEQSFEQVEDDIVYAKHNFGGIGFWPLPLEGEPSFKKLQGIINTHLFNNAEQKYIEKLVSKVLPIEMCDFICTQRGYFRTVLGTLVFFLVVSAFAKSSSCYVCKIIEQYQRTYLSSWIATLVLVLAMLGCDRFFQEHADKAMSGVVVTIVFYFIGNYIINIKKKQLP